MDLRPDRLNAALPPPVFTPLCPLCGNTRTDLFYNETVKKPVREYRFCGECGLIHVPAAYFVSSNDEKRRYDLHRNDPSDSGYRQHLHRLMGPLAARLKRGSRGLDFGAGPGPVLAGMLEAAGHPTEVYDPFYAPRPELLQKNYDFVTATEVIEHLREPARTLETMWALVRPGGWLGLMTQTAPEPDAFGRWSYKNDPTHVLFFSRRTFEWLAVHWGAVVEFPDKSVILLGKRL